MQSVFQEPTVLAGGEARILCVVEMHPGEKFSSEIRAELIHKPVGGVALVDGNIAAMPEGRRCLGGLNPEGNLNLQFGEPQSAHPTDAEKASVLATTKARAAELAQLAKPYGDRLVDYHGCGDFCPSYLWVSSTRLGLDSLKYIAAFAPKTILLGTPGSLIRAHGGGVMADIADSDIVKETERQRQILEAYAADTLALPTRSQLARIGWFRMPGDILSEDWTKLDLGTNYSHGDQVPERVSDYLGVDEHLYVHAANNENKSMEVVCPIDFECFELPAEIA